MKPRKLSYLLYLGSELLRCVLPTILRSKMINYLVALLELGLVKEGKKRTTNMLMVIKSSFHHCTCSMLINLGQKY